MWMFNVSMWILGMGLDGNLLSGYLSLVVCPSLYLLETAESGTNRPRLDFLQGLTKTYFVKQFKK